MNDKYLKIYRFPKNHVFPENTFVEQFEGEKMIDPEELALASGIKGGDDPHNQA
tara:strand:+ start:4935 stop:5096 length:162 start_codon:yes stop_codon:yes gene_type:complete